MFGTEVIKDLFLRDISLYGIEKANGTYSFVRDLLDDEVLDRHIKEKAHVGVKPKA